MIKPQALYTFLSHLSKREKVVVYATAFFISLMLLDRMIISPISGKINSLDKEIQAKESDVKKNLRILAQKNRILTESAKYSFFLAGSKSEEEEMTFILKEIENMANKSSVYLIDLKPGGVKTVGSSKKYAVNLTCEAQMEQLTEFMYDIESSDKLLTIEKYQIGPKSKESSVARCTMSISKIGM